MRRRRAVVPQKVKKLQTRIEHWRRTRRKRSAMPEELWSEAALLARAHGIHRIASALRINYENLKKRVEVAPDGRGNSSAGFVEVEPSQFEDCFAGAQLVGAFESARTVVELCGSDGAKLVVRLSGQEELDVVALAGAFWKRGE